MPSRTEERRLITVLFADLSGFTTLSQDLDPEDVREVANTCFEYLNNAIIKQGGTIHKYEGDLVIALFGLPVTHEDDPERAIKASLEMMKTIPKINETLTLKLNRKVDLDIHIGINSGTVVAGEVGSEEKKEYTVMGEVVNLASRLKDSAKRRDILVSEPVFKASRYLFDYEVLPPLGLKGMEEKVHVFKPLCIKEKPDPKRGIHGLYSPLVGREKELELLKKSFDDLTQGKRIAAFILGDAGLGKSRLWEEFRKTITNNQLPITILEGRCYSHEENFSYGPFLRMLKNIFGITNQDPPVTIQEKVLETTKHMFPQEYKEVAPYIGYLFSIRFSDELDERVKYLDAKGLKIQILLSFKKLFTALANKQPLTIFIEDFHWIDSASLELFEYIFDIPDFFPTLFVCASRIEKEKNFWKAKEKIKKKVGKDFLEITLNPLNHEESAELTYNLLKIPNIPEAFKEKILSKAEGNPFYIEEILRSLIDVGLLIFKSGIWYLKSQEEIEKEGQVDISDIEIPNTVQAVILSRVDRLEPDVKNDMLMASVIGRNFYARILEHLCGIDSLMISLNLATLEEFEYIKEVKREPELEYTFRHPLIQEIAYHSLLKKKRKELHQKIGNVIEEIYKDRLEEFTDILAFQYANSDNFDKAIEWLKKAGEHAKERYVSESAIKYFQKAMSIIKKEKKGREGELCSIYEALGEIQELKGEYESAKKHYEEMYDTSTDAITQSRAKRKIAGVNQIQGKFNDAFKILDAADGLLKGDSVDEMLEKSLIHTLKCEIYQIRGEIEKAIKDGETALGIAGQIKIDDHRVKQTKARALNRLGTTYLYKSEYDTAIEYFQKFLKISEELGDKKEISGANFNLGSVYYIQGQYEKAIKLFEKFLQISEEIGFKQGIGMACYNLGNVYLYKCDYDKAIELIEKYLRISEEIGYKRGICQAFSSLASVYYSKGEYEKTIELLQKDLKISEEIGYPRETGIASANLGNLFLEINRLDEAEEYLLKSEKVFKKVGYKKALAEIYSQLGILQVKKKGKSSLEEALKYANHGLEIAEEIDSKPERANCYFAHGIIYASLREIKEAEEYFNKAIEIFEGLKQLKSLADVHLEYAKMLKEGGKKEETKLHSDKAMKIYKELKLSHLVEKIEKLWSDK